MDDGTPALEVGFAIDMGGSFEELTRLQSLMDTTEARVVAEAQKIEQATSGMLNMSGATASITAFGSATTREAANTTRELSRLEKQADVLISRMLAQANALGKTKDELQDAKVEALALSTAEKGLTDSSDQLLAASRQLQAVKQSLAEAALERQTLVEAQAAQALADSQRAVIVQLQERAQLEAAIQRNTGVGQIRASDAGATYSALAAQAAEEEAQAYRDAAAAYAMFQARAQQGLATWKAEEASMEADAAAVARLRAALDPAAAAQQRLTEEIAEARRVMIAAGADAEELAQVEALLARRMQETGVSSGAQRAAIQNFGFQVQDFAVQVTGGTSALRAFAQQFPQAAGAMTGMEGKLGAIGAFLNGPWGIALTLAITLLAGFGDKLFASGDASDAAGAAHKRHASAVDALSDAIKALNAVSGIEHTMHLQAEADAERAVVKAKNEAEAKLSVARATLVKAQADAQAAAASNVPGAPSYVGTGINELATAGYVKGVQSQVAALTAEINKADQSLRSFAGFKLDRQVEAQFDKNTAAVQRFDKEHERLAGLLAAGSISNATYVAGMQAATAARNAATEADKRGGAAKIAHTAALRAQALAEREHAKQAREAAAALREQEAAEKELQGVFSTLQAKYDPATKALRDYFDTVNNIQRAVQAGLIDRSSGTDWILKSADEYAAAVAKINEAANSLKMPDVADLSKTLGEQLHDFTGKSAEAASGIHSIGDAFQSVTYSADGLFSSHSAGMKAMEKAEKAYRAVQFALSVKALAQDVAETVSSVTNSTTRAAADTAAGGAKMFSQLGIGGFVAVGAMIAVMASLGFHGGGSSSAAPVTNTGTGTVLGDDSAKSDSLQRSIDALKDVDSLTMTYSRDMLASLKSIDSQIGGLASLIVRTGSLDASTVGVKEGFNSSLSKTAVEAVLGGPLAVVASKIPVLGGIIDGIAGVISSLFGSKTKVVGNGIFADPQALSSILSGGFDAESYADIQKTKKFLGITTSKKVKTQYGDLDDSVEQQFALILKGFDDAISAAAGPLGLATSDITKRLDSFVVNIGKVDLTGLSGEEIQEKLENVFGAVGDNMAKAAIPGLEKFQQVGEGYLQTLVRVASTVETVTTAFDKLGQSGAAAALGIDGSMNLAGQFDSTSDFSSAIDTYFQDFYSEAEQTAAKTAQLGKVFGSLGLQMPDTIAGFRQLVEAQDLSTTAGQDTYATLIKLAPAFSDLQSALGDAASAADILRERQDLERQLLEAQGDTAAIRASELQSVDASNRALQQLVWATQDAKAAADAAAQAEEQLAQQRASLEQQIMSLTGDTAGIRAAELAAMDESLRPLQQRIYALQDEQAATQAATQAAEAAAQAQAAIDQERAGIQSQLWQLEGNTAAIRAAELAQLDPTNRALQQMVYNLQDAQAATEAASQAAEEAAQKQAAIEQERQGLLQQLYQLQGNTAALRQMELAGLDASNRALQQQIYALTDAQAAAEKAQDLADAWASVGDSIMDEIKRIRGLTDAGGGNSFASLQGQFNAATAAARGGDQDAAKSLPDLSKSLLDAAALAATSRQELARIEAQTAASLSATYDLIGKATDASSAATSAILGSASSTASSSLEAQSWWAAFAATQGASTAANANDALVTEVRNLRAEVKQLREENNSGNAQVAANTGKTAKTLDNVTRPTGGNAVAVEAAA